MRNFVLKRPKLTLVVFITLTFLFLYGNAQVKKGGVLDNALTDKKDPYYQMDKTVAECFPGSEKMVFVFREKIDSVDDIKEIYEMSEKLKKYEWAKERVLSLSTVPNFKVKDNELWLEPFITESMLLDGDIKDFKNAVQGSEVVYGKLIGREFDWALAVVFLEREHNQEEIYWDVVEILEGKEVPWWKRYLRYDIGPKDARWGVCSWVVGRETIDLVLRFDIVKIIVLASVPVIFVVFLFSFGSLSQALISVGVIVLSLVWTRGTIWALDSLGWQFNEKVYILLTYANNIVQGSSFCLHKFHAFQKQGSWKKGQIVDRLILITGGISSGGLLTLYSFKVLTIREMGVLSAFGIAYLVAFSILLIPALHLTFSRGKQARQKSNFLRKLSLADFLERLSRCIGFIVKEQPNKLLAGGLILVLAAGLMVFSGRIIVGTRPLDFIHGTHIWRTALWLNERVGFDEVELMVEPAQGLREEHVLRSPKFVSQLRDFEQDILKIEGATVILSAIDALSRISTEFYERPLPESAVEAGFNLMQLNSSSDIGQPILTDLYNEKAVKMSVFTTTADDSIKLRQFWGNIENLAQEKYPDFKVSFGGKTFLWSLQDQYISYGKPLNVASSEIWIILISFLMVWARNKKMRCRNLGAIRAGIVMAAPLFFATACMILAMVIFRIRLDQANAVIMAMAIGASIDFSIYFVDAFQAAIAKGQKWAEAVQYASQSKGPVILTDVTLNILGFLPLTLSYFGPVAMLGWLTGAMLFFSAIGSLFVMPPLLRFAGLSRG